MAEQVVQLTEYAMGLLDISSIKMYTLIDGSTEPEFTFELRTSESDHKISAYVSVLGDNSFMTRIYGDSLNFKLTVEAKEELEVKVTQIIRMLFSWLEVRDGGVAIKCSN